MKAIAAATLQCEARGGSGGGGRQRQVSAEPGSQAPRSKKAKTAAGYAATQWHPASKFLSFDAARTFVRALKMWGVKEWLEYSKSGKRPPNIPGNPDKTYRGAGWISMPDWMGYAGKEAMAPGCALSFVAARAIVMASRGRDMRRTSAITHPSAKRTQNPAARNHGHQSGPQRDMLRLRAKQLETF